MDIYILDGMRLLILIGMFFIFRWVCLRRLTFFQQLKKVSKKSRPSGAGRADFPQISSAGTTDHLACKRRGGYCISSWTEWRGKSVMVWGGCLLVMGCGDGGGRVEVEDVWIRENIGGQKITAGYLVLSNGGEATALVSANTDVAEVTELHVVTAQNNVMQMRKVEGIPISAHGMATLQPGGNHLMLIGLKRDLVVGEEIGVTLRFENGQTTTVKAVVKEVGGNG
jgi:copper(I)-binding protein